MEWKATWNDPLTSYVNAFDELIGDQRTRKTLVKHFEALLERAV
jgi:hypothetical protein